jgi:hypothetical protein
MPWILAFFTALIVIALTHFCVINARTIMRDMNKTFDAFQARLERDANAVVDTFFSANQADDVNPGPSRPVHPDSNSRDHA